MITTKNLIIDPELCKRLDKNFYGKNPSELVINKSKLYRTELLDLIRSYSTKVAEIEKESCLYKLCLVADTVQKHYSKVQNERGRANMQTAHNNLANYK